MVLELRPSIAPVNSHVICVDCDVMNVWFLMCFTAQHESAAWGSAQVVVTTILQGPFLRSLCLLEQHLPFLLCSCHWQAHILVREILGVFGGS